MEKQIISNKIINEIQFDIVAQRARNDIHKMFQLMLKSGIDNISYGFWIWDLSKQIEIYSPKFRTILGYVSEEDFPDHPDSWQKCIAPNDLKKAKDNLKTHIESKGLYPYYQDVVYFKKNKETLHLICHGNIVIWDGDKPQIMIGVHMPRVYMFDVL